jgi:uncharacterized membrane protein
MFRAVFMIGLFAVVGLFLLSSVFGIFRFLVSVAIVLVILALKICFVGLLVYLVIRVVSPETASRLKSRFSGSAF